MTTFQSLHYKTRETNVVDSGKNGILPKRLMDQLFVQRTMYLGILTVILAIPGGFWFSKVDRTNTAQDQCIPELEYITVVIPLVRQEVTYSFVQCGHQVYQELLHIWIIVLQKYYHRLNFLHLSSCFYQNQTYLGRVMERLILEKSIP